jgi:hypothetical protein
MGRRSPAQIALQSTFLWGCVGVAGAVVLAVVAAMIHDIRWVLIFAWPFAGFAVWEFARTIYRSKVKIYGATSAGALLTGALLAWLYFALAPTGTRVADSAPAEIAKQGASIGSPIPLLSTSGKTFFRCPLPPVPTDRTLKQIDSDLEERMDAARDVFGVFLEVSEIRNGRKIVMTPATPEGQQRMAGATKWTFEMRKSGPELLVTSIVDLPEPLGSLLKIIPIDPKSDQVALGNKWIEDLLHIPSGQCRML